MDGCMTVDSLKLQSVRFKTLSIAHMQTTSPSTELKHIWTLPSSQMSLAFFYFIVFFEQRIMYWFQSVNISELV